jgi:uncharacterized protein (TIGR00730 family)
MKLNVVCVYCGSSPGNESIYTESAAALGRLLAKRGTDIVYGGSSWGMMGAVANAALEAGGRVIGILPRGLASKEKAHPHLTEMHLVDSMHQRKALMERMSDGFIALPGGLGTLEELCEVTTWAQLGIHQKPIGLCNISGYFDGFLGFLDHAVATGYLSSDHRRLILTEEAPDDLVESMERFQPYLDKIWLDESEI